MDIRKITQQILDKILLPEGVISSHIRRVEVDSLRVKNRTVNVNKDEYVIYRIVSSKQRTYGDGVAQLNQFYIDVNYYYAYDKADKRLNNVNTRIKNILEEFLSNPMFRLANGQSDLPDVDNPYRGINVEFLYIGVADYEQ